MPITPHQQTCKHYCPLGEIQHAQQSSTNLARYFMLPSKTRRGQTNRSGADEADISAGQSCSGVRRFVTDLQLSVFERGGGMRKDLYIRMDAQIMDFAGGLLSQNDLVSISRQCC